MTQTKTSRCVPVLREIDKDMPPHAFIDGFTPGYIRRAAKIFPKQSDRLPWLNPQNYQKDKQMLRHDPLADGVLTFSNG